MKYSFLNDLSGALILLTVTLIFSMLFEPRYPIKIYLKSLIPFLAVLFAVNFAVLFTQGFASYGKLTLLIATLPSCLYFFITSKSRDGRFFFTFCLVDTLSIWFSLVTGLIDYFLGAEGIFNFAARLVAAPIAIYCVYRWVRAPYFAFLHTVQKGWWLFTAMTGIVYVMLIVIGTVPCSLRQRPEDMPVAILVSIFIPLAYTVIFYMLISQKKLHDMGTLQHIFATQTAIMKARAEEIRSAEDTLRIQRHDMRHKLKIIEEFALKGEQQQALEFLGSSQKELDEACVSHCCTNPILDAILSSYFRQAGEAGIELDYHLSIPDELPVPATELATVFANALENAICACSALPEGQRKIHCVCITKPTLMFEVKNTFLGTAEFDSDGLPIARAEDHGIGSRSILAFCKKYDATYIYEARDGWFHLMVSL